MAGEIEEPCSFSLQTESLHSGSISFGRFEHEALSWERRSVFSHNRYVEEVEKCMKPGSVTERKAYFEAHFKKKGFPRPNLSECHSGTDYGVCGDNVSDSDDSYKEEFEHENEGRSYAELDQSSEDSVYHGGFEVIKCRIVDPEVSVSSPQKASVLNQIAILVDGAVEEVNFEETHHTEKCCDKFSSIVEDESKKYNGGVVNADEPSNTVSMCYKPESAGNVDKPIVDNVQTSLKLKATKETKKFRPLASISQVRRSVSAEASKDPTKSSNPGARVGTRRMVQEKLPSKAMPTTNSVSRIPKIEESRGLKAKSLHESKSKPEPRGRQITNRYNHQANVTKSTSRSSVTTFKLKSSERAEQRKELEEKMQSKEDEINKVQARQQEKREAEKKKFQKGLNFKAAPMPSFYMTSTPDGSKTVLTKLSKVQRSQGNAPGVKFAPVLDAAGQTNCMMAEASVTKIEITGMKEREKDTKEKRYRVLSGSKVAKNRVKDTNERRHGVLPEIKVAKNQITDEKQKEKAHKISRRRVGFGSSSKMSHLAAVGVAS